MGGTDKQSKKGQKEKQAAVQQPAVEEKEDEKRSSNPQTPKQNKQVDLDKTATDSGNKQYPYNSQFNNSSGKKSRYKGKGFDANGRPRNFYNPPGKVMRHLAQQSYYDNFYGSQGQFNTLKQKYKTQLCKHFLENKNCPLSQYCQFAHGQDDLRQPNDVSVFLYISRHGLYLAFNI